MLDSNNCNQFTVRKQMINSKKIIRVWSNAWNHLIVWKKGCFILECYEQNVFTNHIFNKYV